MTHFGLGPPEALIVLAMGLSSVIPAVFACLIFAKAGYHWALGLFVLIPIANLIVLIYFAFDRWPILAELEKLKHQQKSVG